MTTLRSWALALMLLAQTGQDAEDPAARARRDAAMEEATRLSMEIRRELTGWYQRMDEAEAAGRAFHETDPTADHVRRLQERLAEQGDAEGAILFRALIVQITNDPQQRMAVARRAIAAHGSSPHLTPLVAAIRWSVSSQDRGPLLDAILEVNQHPRVRAEARLTRAGRWLPDRRRPDVPEQEIQRGIAELRRALEEASRLPAGAPEVWTRLPIAPDEDLRASIEGRLFQVERLRVGLVAPDIEGEDLDGVEFRLSDYRGKVVVLDFWGHW